MSLKELRKQQGKISHFYVLARTYGDSKAAAKVVDEVEKMKKTLSAVSGAMNYVLKRNRLCRTYSERLFVKDDMSHCKL